MGADPSPTGRTTAPASSGPAAASSRVPGLADWKPEAAPLLPHPSRGPMAKAAPATIVRRQPTREDGHGTLEHYEAGRDLARQRFGLERQGTKPRLSLRRLREALRRPGSPGLPPRLHPSPWQPSARRRRRRRMPRGPCRPRRSRRPRRCTPAGSSVNAVDVAVAVDRAAVVLGAERHRRRRPLPRAHEPTGARVGARQRIAPVSFGDVVLTDAGDGSQGKHRQKQTDSDAYAQQHGNTFLELGSLHFSLRLAGPAPRSAPARRR